MGMFDVKDSDFFELEEEDFDTVLADDISFNGSIVFKKPFMIKGKVQGTIDSASDLVIDTNAHVEANITAKRVLIRGKLRGDIITNGLVFITKSGVVYGNIESANVVLEPGSTFSGQCIMPEDKKI